VFDDYHQTVIMWLDVFVKGSELRGVVAGVNVVSRVLCLSVRQRRRSVQITRCSKKYSIASKLQPYVLAACPGNHCYLHPSANCN
jgi:hypothetical protein